MKTGLNSQRSVRAQRRKPAATVLAAMCLVLATPYAAGALNASNAAGGHSASYRRVATMTGPNIPPSGMWSFDIGWVDQNAQRYLLSDTANNSLDVFDARRLSFVRAVHGLPGPNGVTVDDNGLAWVAGGDSAVRVVDVAGGRIVATIETGGSGAADEIGFDPIDHLMLVDNPRENPPASPFLTIISTVTRRVVGRIALSDAGPLTEQPVWDGGSRRFLVPTEEPIDDLTALAIGEVIYVNPLSRQITRRLPLGACLPTGAVLGPHREMLVGCADMGAVIVNVDSGRVVATILGDPGVDEVAYDPDANAYYVADGTSPNPALLIVDANSHQIVATLPTGLQAHSVAASWALGRIFVPISGQGVAVFRRNLPAPTSTST